MMRNYKWALSLPMALSCAFPALAQDDSLEQILACRQITEDAARLACFDTASGSLASDRESGELVTISRAEVEAVERETFGFNLPSLPSFTIPRLGRDTNSTPTASALTRSEDGETETTDTITIVERDSQGGVQKVEMLITEARRVGHSWIFTMENGQVWRQTSSDNIRVPSTRNGPRRAEIRRGSLNSFQMRIEGGRSIPVRRVE